MASPQIITSDFSQLVGTTAVLVWVANPFHNQPISYMRIYNASASATLWASRAGTAVIGGPGSFPIQPQTYELWVYPGPIPINALSIVATSGATPVTIEVG